MRIAVLGATGRLGQVLLPRLVAAGHEVTAVVRRVPQLALVGELGANGALGDVEGGEHGDLGPAFTGADVVVWTIGATPSDPSGHAERIADGGATAVAAAAEAGVGRWIQVSSMFANRPEQAPPPLQPSMRLKGRLDHVVTASALPWTVVRPGGLGNGPGGGRVQIGTELPAGGVLRDDVAAVVAELIATRAGIGAAFDLVAGGTPVPEAVAAL